MEKVSAILLGLHVAAGFTALAAGITALVAKKGGKVHNGFGKLYYWAMVIIGVTALAVAIPRGNMFLLMIGGFSTYMTLTGNRYIQFRRNPKLQFGKLDYLFLVVGFITLLIPSVYFTYYGWFNMGGFSIVYLFFGTILLSMLIQDLRNGHKIQDLGKGGLLRMHISRMGGAFIATNTAFLVQNWRVEPGFISWLLPTILLVPVLQYYVRKFKVSKKQLEKKVY